MKTLAVFISGRGSNLQALHRSIQQQDLPLNIGVVVVNDSTAAGIEFCQQHNLPYEIISHRGVSKADFEAAILATLERHQIQLIVLAGFMRILSADFIAKSPVIVNIHPSILPDYKGVDTHQRVLEDGMSWHGASVHLVTPELDAGEIIAQAKVPVLAGDDAQRLAERVLSIEHTLYPFVLRLWAENILSLDNGNITLCNQPLAAPLQLAIPYK